MAAVSVHWPPDGGARLRVARVDASQTQDQAVEWLAANTPISPTQPQLALWELAKRRPRGANRHALLTYIETFGTSYAAPSTSRDDAEDQEATVEFDAAVREFAQEPLLGPLQQRLVEAGIEHHRLLAMPMSPSDEVAWRDMLRILRLD